MSVGVILVAAGQGARLGSARPKALVALNGSPLVAHAVRAVLGCPAVRHVVVLAPPDRVSQVRAAVDATAGSEGAGSRAEVDVLAGGRDRTESVALGLAALPAQIGVVLVHDAARPLTPPAVFDRVVHALRAGHAAVVPVLPVPDTVKVVEQDADGGWQVTGTPPRSTLRVVQTPQGFLRETLERAHAHHADRDGVTDDAGLVERFGGRVHVVPGDPIAMKVTTAADLQVLRALSGPAPAKDRPLLLVLGGPPGAGKTTIARSWAAARRAAHVRIDTIEQALVRGGVDHDLGPLGYSAAYALATDQLQLGLDVVADSVNPLEVTRQAWREVGWRAGARVVQVEVVCGDNGEHRRRVEDREADIAGHQVPGWEQAGRLDYAPWTGVDLRLDTCEATVSEAVRAITEAIQ